MWNYSLINNKKLKDRKRLNFIVKYIMILDIEKVKQLIYCTKIIFRQNT